MVLAATAAVHLSVAALGLPTLARNGFLYDDSFYAFQIAHHIAQGVGPTFDGVHLTNGFQPLYVAILVPIFLVTGDNPSLPVHLALVLSALLTVATAYLVYRLVARRARESAALIAAGAWAFSPIVMRQAANGLETALAVFMLALTTVYYVERVRPVTDAPRRRFVTIGALLGAAFLARADLGLLALVMCLDYLLVLRRRGAGLRWRGDVAAAVAVAGLVCLPWLIYGAVAVGSPIPESGRATRFLSVAYAPLFGLGPASMVENGPTLPFIAQHLEHSMDTLRVLPAVHPLFRAVRKISAPGPGSDPVGAVTDVMGILALAGFAVWWYRRRRRWAARDYDFLLLFAVVMILAYSTVVFGIFFFLRYYYPLYFVGMVFAGLFADDVITWVARQPHAVRRAALAASGVYASALLFMGYTAAYRTTPIYRFYDVARWVATHTDASDTIGVFQGGAIGYFSNRHVVNLDGKVNGAALHALETGHMGEYVREAGIDVVMDSENVLDLFFGPWSDAERRRIEAASVFIGGEHGMPGWIGYRVSPPRVMGASGPTPSVESPRDP